MGSFRLPSNPARASRGGTPKQHEGRRVGRFGKSANAVYGVDKHWIKRIESAEDTFGHNSMLLPSEAISPVIRMLASPGQQNSYISSEELEALVLEGPKDVREMLPTTVMEREHGVHVKEVDTIHRMLEVFLRGFGMLAAELTTAAADPRATLAEVWGTFCRSAEVTYTAKYKSEISQFLHRDQNDLAHKMVEAQELSRKVYIHEHDNMVVAQRLCRVLAEQRRILDDVATNEMDVERWRAKAEEAVRERDDMAPKLESAQTRIHSLEEALQGLSQLVEVASDQDEVREQLEAEYGAELQRQQALTAAAQQEATNAMAREREALAAEELTRREKRRAQAVVSELRDNLDRQRRDFDKLQVSTVEQRARAESAIFTVNREVSVERIARESAQREAAQARVEASQEGQRTKAALQAEADQVGRTRNTVVELVERKRDLATERSRVRMAGAGRQAAEEAADALRRQLEVAQKSLVLYRAAAGEQVANGDQATVQLVVVEHELTESAALVQYLSVENDRLKMESDEMRNWLATSQEGDVEHTRAFAAITAEMDALHGKMREAQRTAAAATTELLSTKKQVTECLVTLQETTRTAVGVGTTLEAETKTRLRMEDELGLANSQLADLMRLVRELKAAQKDQGGLIQDLGEARVALLAAREEVDALRLRLSGFNQEVPASMGGLIAQKDIKLQLETARNELFSVYTMGRHSADGVEPAGNALADEGAALEAVRDALTDCHSQSNRWREKVKALNEEVIRKDGEARDAHTAVSKKKEEAKERANQTEIDAIQEVDIVHEAVNRLEGRINRLRMELFATLTGIKDALNDAGHAQSLLPTPEPTSADDQKLYSVSKQHLDILGQVIGLASEDIDKRANQFTELSLASAGDKARIASLEAELRTIGEASENARRDREEAAEGLMAARKALSGSKARLAVAEACARSAEILLTKGIQVGPGLQEPKAEFDKRSHQVEAIKPNAMDDGILPEHIDRVIPREPPPPPRIKDGSGGNSALPARLVANGWQEGDMSSDGRFLAKTGGSPKIHGGWVAAASARVYKASAVAADQDKYVSNVLRGFPRRLVVRGGTRSHATNDAATYHYDIGSCGAHEHLDDDDEEPDPLPRAPPHYQRGWGTTWGETTRSRADLSPQGTIIRAGIPNVSGTTSLATCRACLDSASNRLGLRHLSSSVPPATLACGQRFDDSEAVYTPFTSRTDETQPQARGSLCDKANEQLVRPGPPPVAAGPTPSARPQTSPATSAQQRYTKHTIPLRHELPMGVLQLNSTASAWLPNEDAHHRSMVPTRLKELMNRF